MIQAIAAAMVARTDRRDKDSKEAARWRAVRRSADPAAAAVALCAAEDDADAFLTAREAFDALVATHDASVAAEGFVETLDRIWQVPGAGGMSQEP